MAYQLGESGVGWAHFCIPARKSNICSQIFLIFGLIVYSDFFYSYLRNKWF